MQTSMGSVTGRIWGSNSLMAMHGFGSSLRQSYFCQQCHISTRKDIRHGSNWRQLTMILKPRISVVSWVEWQPFRFHVPVPEMALWVMVRRKLWAVAQQSKRNSQAILKNSALIELCLMSAFTELCHPRMSFLAWPLIHCQQHYQVAVFRVHAEGKKSGHGRCPRIKFPFLKHQDRIADQTIDWDWFAVVWSCASLCCCVITSVLHYAKWHSYHIIPTAATSWLKETTHLVRKEGWTALRAGPQGLKLDYYFDLVNYVSLQLSLGHASGTLLHRVWCMQPAAKQFDLAAKQAAARLFVLASKQAAARLPDLASKQASCCKAVWPCCKASKLLQSSLVLLQSKQAATKQFDLAAKQASCYKAVWSCCKATWSFCKACCRKFSQILIATKPAVFTKKKQLMRFQVKQKQQLKYNSINLMNSII